MTRHVLVVASSHGELAGQPNGTYVPELTHAVHMLDEHGITYDLASPGGGSIPLYGTEADDLTQRMLAEPRFVAQLNDTMRLEEVDPAHYDAVFFPGGYGLLFDLVENRDSHRIALALHARGALIAAVCHGPAALCALKLPDGRSLLADRQVTGFTREEEVAMNTLAKVPFVLEERLLETGAVYRKKAKWQVLVVRDGNLITGQNPASASAVGSALAEALAERTHDARR